MKLEKFIECFNECQPSDKLSMFNEYQIECRGDDEIFSFDEEFFNCFFSDRPMELVRAIHFGDVDYNDGFIKFDGYGNLESLSESEVEEWCDDAAEDIYDYPEIWGKYIDDEDDEEDEL